jgi:hypothetical protein
MAVEGRKQPSKKPQRSIEVITVEYDLEPDEFRPAFLLRAVDALASAVYSGPVDAEVIAAAGRVVAKWKQLAKAMRQDAAFGVAEASNEFHREVVGNIMQDLAPRFRAWFNATKLTDEAKDSLHDVLMLAANELMTLAQEIDGRGANSQIEAAA